MNRYVEVSKLFKTVFTVSVSCRGDSGHRNGTPRWIRVLCLRSPHPPALAAEAAASLTLSSARKWGPSETELPGANACPSREKGNDMVGAPNVQSAALSMQEIITLTFGFGNSPVLLSGAKATHLFQRRKWDISLNLLSVTLPGCCHLPDRSGGRWTGHAAPCMGPG